MRVTGILSETEVVTAIAYTTSYFRKHSSVSLPVYLFVNAGPGLLWFIVATVLTFMSD